MSKISARPLILVLDIGNTDTVFAIFRSDKLLTTWRIPGKTLRTRNDVWSRVEKQFRRVRLHTDGIRGTAIASVNPVLTKLCSSAIRQHLHHLPLIIDGRMDAGLKIRYHNPRLLGPDRLCNAVAAFHRYGGPVIAVDCGTATTFDVVTAKGEYIGGAIAPGIRTAADALTRATARLPKIDLRFPRSAIGSDTVSCMQAGVLFGGIDGIEGMITRIKLITGRTTKVVLTGGFSRLVKPWTRTIDAVEPLLVLEGAMRIFQHVEERRRKAG